MLGGGGGTSAAVVRRRHTSGWGTYAPRSTPASHTVDPVAGVGSSASSLTVVAFCLPYDISQDRVDLLPFALWVSLPDLALSPLYAPVASTLARASRRGPRTARGRSR